MIARDEFGSKGFVNRIYPLHDANFNIIALADTAGDVLERYAYDPYGLFVKLEADFDPWVSGTDYKWVYFHQGGHYETEIAMYHFRHRELSPTLMRWNRMDPIAYAGGTSNLYDHLLNNPLINIDPLGTQVGGPNHIMQAGSAFQAGAEERWKNDPARLAAVQKRNESLSKILDGAKCCPKEIKDKAKELLVKILNEADFYWPHQTGFLGNCWQWQAEYDKPIDKYTSELDKVKACFKVDIQEWQNKGLVPWLIGAGHIAVRISFCNGETFYLDDGAWGGPAHAFGPSQVPNHVREAPCDRPPPYPPPPPLDW